MLCDGDGKRRVDNPGRPRDPAFKPDFALPVILEAVELLAVHWPDLVDANAQSGLTAGNGHVLLLSQLHATARP